MGTMKLPYVTRVPKRQRPSPLTWPGAGMASDGETLSFSMPVPESANRLFRIFRNQAVKTDLYRANEAGAAVAFEPAEPFVGDVAVDITWYRKSKSGDLDNRVKATLDLLAGYAYGNDSQVAELHVRRVDDRYEPARMVVTVRPLSAGASSGA